MDIHPTGVMWGRGQAKNMAESLALEQQVLEHWQAWKEGLEKQGLSQERRSFRVFPRDFSWQFLDNAQIEIQFSLLAGSYATMVLREIALCTNAQQRN
jgi:tRNA pseudouridine13 synthase